eukprot:6186587-Pleurochrysis_carterae.AAC.1
MARTRVVPAIERRAHGALPATDARWDRVDSAVSLHGARAAGDERGARAEGLRACRTMVMHVSPQQHLKYR